jgi:hypothetical protein
VGGQISSCQVYGAPRRGGWVRVRDRELVLERELVQELVRELVQELVRELVQVRERVLVMMIANYAMIYNHPHYQSMKMNLVMMNAMSFCFLKLNKKTRQCFCSFFLY